MRTYIFKTKRLRFSEWTAKDIDLALDLWGDTQVSRFISADGQFSVQAIEERLFTELENNINFKVQYWPLFKIDSNELVGCCGLRPHMKEPNVYELGFHLKSEYWGEGYAFEAASAVLQYAKTYLKANYIVAGHHPENAASEKLLKKLGFRYSHHEHYSPTGLEHPSYLIEWK
ncbi:GNAT family N-acetyltransferase [Paenibacillus sp. N3/727]|uniref:GNAT family N-acetyltransferase n=1 Tax=Paenibacillus sp. N3/727 TaxID=2925845 RepID=UPI001F534152|nr:GNAT family N-acetyltransferase [Paenibacillus sp. N3/727]UNK20447.1 GNAT family N-acetyltransferase [Paenibacillus sp. N3/727]